MVEGDGESAEKNVDYLGWPRREKFKVTLATMP